MAELLLIVGLPGAGKTTLAKTLAAEHRALRLTPDEWVIAVFGGRDDEKRWALEGCLLNLAFEALKLDTSVVLDFGLWGRDERSALRFLAAAVGARSGVVYVPVDRETQLSRIAHRQATTPHQTFPMTEAEVDSWRKQFQAPDQPELDGTGLDGPPPGWPSWPAWAADHWPGLTLPPAEGGRGPSPAPDIGRRGRAVSLGVPRCRGWSRRGGGWLGRVRAG